MPQPKTFFSAQDFNMLKASEQVLSELLDEMPFFDPSEQDALTNHRRGQFEECVKQAQGALWELVCFVGHGGGADFVERATVEDIPVQ